MDSRIRKKSVEPAPAYHPSEEAGEVSPDLAASRTLDTVILELLTAETVVRQASFRVTGPKMMMSDHDTPAVGGLYDLRLGPKGTSQCRTCGERERCMNHKGYYELAVPLYPVFNIRYILQALRCICRWCGRLKIILSPGPAQHPCVPILRKIKPSQRLRLLSDKCKTKDVCLHADCRMPQPSFVISNNIEIACSWSAEKTSTLPGPARALTQAPFTTTTAFHMLSCIPREISAMYMGMGKRTRLSDLMVTVLPIPPVMVRPSTIGNGVGRNNKMHDDITSFLQRIMKQDEIYRAKLSAMKSRGDAAPFKGVTPEDITRALGKARGASRVTKAAANHPRFPLVPMDAPEDLTRAVTELVAYVRRMGIDLNPTTGKKLSTAAITKAARAAAVADEKEGAGFGEEKAGDGVDVGGSVHTCAACKKEIADDPDEDGAGAGGVRLCPACVSTCCHQCTGKLGTKKTGAAVTCMDCACVTGSLCGCMRVRLYTRMEGVCSSCAVPARVRELVCDGPLVACDQCMGPLGKGMTGASDADVTRWCTEATAKSGGVLWLGMSNGAVCIACADD